MSGGVGDGREWHSLRSPRGRLTAERRVYDGRTPKGCGEFVIVRRCIGRWGGSARAVP